MMSIVRVRPISAHKTAQPLIAILVLVVICNIMHLSIADNLG